MLTLHWWYRHKFVFDLSTFDAENCLHCNAMRFSFMTQTNFIINVFR